MHGVELQWNEKVKPMKRMAPRYMHLDNHHEWDLYKAFRDKWREKDEARKKKNRDVQREARKKRKKRKGEAAAAAAAAAVSGL